MTCFLARAALLASSLLASAAFAGEHRIPTIEGGAVLIDVPADWVGTNLIPQGPVVTAVFRRDGDPKFKLMVSVVVGEAPAFDAAALREAVDESAARAGASAVSPPVVAELAGARMRAAYFHATDRTEPLPADGYRHMSQGIAAIDGQPATFTLLPNDAGATLARRRDEALAALRTLRPED